jgi:hypothetical protein
VPVKILYLLTRELGATGEELRREHAREHTVDVVDLAGERDYDRIVDAIAAADRVVCW